VASLTQIDQIQPKSERKLCGVIFARALSRLKKLNPNAFMFVDEPGLQFLFSAMAGYGDQAARADMEVFFSMIERPRGQGIQNDPESFLRAS